MTRKTTLWLLVALLAVLGLAAFWYWGARDSRLPPAPLHRPRRDRR